MQTSPGATHKKRHRSPVEHVHGGYSPSGRFRTPDRLKATATNKRTMQIPSPASFIQSCALCHTCIIEHPGPLLLLPFLILLERVLPCALSGWLTTHALCTPCLLACLLVHCQFQVTHTTKPAALPVQNEYNKKSNTTTLAVFQCIKIEKNKKSNTTTSAVS